MYRALRLLTVIVLIAALAGACALPAQQPKDTVKVTLALDWFPWSNHSGLFVAQEKGYFRDEGLEVNIYTPADPSSVLQTVGAGRDDFGISYQTAVLLARAEDVPVVSIAALVQHPLNSIMTLKTSGIEKPGQLKGKKVGYPGTPDNEPLLDTMLKKEGLTLKDIELVNVGYDLVPALIGKKVDAIIGAYWVHESIDAELQGFPVNIMRMEQWGVPDFYELVLVASEKTVVERSDVAERFARAVVRGYRDAAADPKAAIDTLVKANPGAINEAIERKGIDLLLPMWAEASAGFGTQTQARWDGYAAWLQTSGLLTKPVEARAAYTDRFIAAAHKAK